MNSVFDKMSLNFYLVILSVLITVSAKISNEGDNTGLETPNLTGCQCVNYDCGCCQHIKVKAVHLDDTMCTNITYLPDDYGFTMTVTFDSFTLFNTTVSARNPPPICIGQDYVKQLEAEICIRFYNLDANKHHLHGCLKFEVELYRMKMATYDLGCFDVGPKNPKNNENVIKTKLGTLLSRNQVPQVILV